MSTLFFNYIIFSQILNVEMMGYNISFSKTKGSNYRILKFPCLTATNKKHSPSFHGIFEIITFKGQCFYFCYSWISSHNKVFYAKIHEK
jgi:hypothetical protein